MRTPSVADSRALDRRRAPGDGRAAARNLLRKGVTMNRSTRITSQAFVERLEDRRLLSATIVAPAHLTDSAASLMNSRAAQGFLGVYFGTVNVAGAGTVTMTCDVEQFVSRTRFMQLDLIYGPVARPFTGTYSRRNGAVIFSSTNGTDSLTFSGKLIRNGKAIQITFTENFKGQQYRGTNLKLPRAP
jgi:hypothetical protein